LNTEAQLLFSHQAPVGAYEIWQNGSVRYLYINGKLAIQSQVDMAQKEKLLLQHSRAMMTFLLFNPKPKSVLLFGLGGGSIIHFFSHWLAKTDITAVDISSAIIDVATRYFGIIETPKIHLKQADAFQYLSQSRRKNTDVILVDIHDGISIPDLLHNPRFIAGCFNRLSGNGVLVLNLLVNTDHEFLRILTALREYFTNISLCIELQDQKNIILLAFKSRKTLNKEKLFNKAKQARIIYGIEFDEFVKGFVVVKPKSG